MVKVKSEKRVTQCRRITKYVNGITATEGLTQPCEFMGFTFLIAFLSQELPEQQYPELLPMLSCFLISVSPSATDK